MNNNEFITKTIETSAQEYQEPSETDPAPAPLTSKVTNIAEKGYSDLKSHTANKIEKGSDQRLPISSGKSTPNDLSQFLQSPLGPFEQNSGVFAMNASAVFVGRNSKHNPLVQWCNRFQTQSDLFDDIFAPNINGKLEKQQVQLGQYTHTFEFAHKELRNQGDKDLSNYIETQTVYALAKRYQAEILMGSPAYNRAADGRNIAPLQYQGTNTEGFESLFSHIGANVKCSIGDLLNFQVNLRSEYKQGAVWIMSKKSYGKICEAFSADPALKLYLTQLLEQTLLGRPILVLDYPYPDNTQEQYKYNTCQSWSCIRSSRIHRRTNAQR